MIIITIFCGSNSNPINKLQNIWLRANNVIFMSS